MKKCSKKKRLICPKWCGHYCREHWIVTASGAAVDKKIYKVKHNPLLTAAEKKHLIRNLHYKDLCLVGKDKCINDCRRYCNEK